MKGGVKLKRGPGKGQRNWIWGEGGEGGVEAGGEERREGWREERGGTT